MNTQKIFKILKSRDYEKTERDLKYIEDLMALHFARHNVLVIRGIRKTFKAINRHLKEKG